MTLISEGIDETEERGRRFFVLRSIVKVVYVPTTMVWDDGVPLNRSEAALVLDRIRQVLDRVDKDYFRIVVDDGIYEKVRRSMDRTEGDARI